MSKQKRSTLLGGVRGSLLPRIYRLHNIHSSSGRSVQRLLNLPLTCKINQQQKNKTILCPMYQECPLNICGARQQNCVIAVSLVVIFLHNLFFFFNPFVCWPSNKVSQHNGGTCLTMVLLQCCGQKQQRRRKSEADSREKMMLSFYSW